MGREAFVHSNHTYILVIPLDVYPSAIKFDRGDTVTDPSSDTKISNDDMNGGESGDARRFVEPQS